MAKQSSKRGKLSASTKVDNKVAFILIGLLAIVGGFLIYRSQASTYTFIRSGNQLSSIQGTRTFDNSTYYLISDRTAPSIGFVGTIASKEEVSKSSDVCAHFKVFAPNSTTTTIRLEQKNSSMTTLASGTYSFGSATTDGYVCLHKKPSAQASVLTVTTGTKDGSFGTIGINRIYGKL